MPSGEQFIQPFIAHELLVFNHLLQIGPLTPIWFERVRRRLHLPIWAGAIVVAVIPFILLDSITSYLAGAWGYFLSVELPQYYNLIPFMGLEYYGAVYSYTRVEKLQAYCNDMGVSSDIRLDLNNLTNSKRIVVLAAGLFTVFVPIYVLFGSQNLSLVQSIIVLTIPWAYFLLVLGSFIYVYSYSMYSIYKMGNLPLNLKPFTEDRTLGLRPFGAVSLRLTLVYLAVVVFAMLSASQDPVGLGVSGSGGFFLVLSFTGLGCASLILFILPLVGLHRKLVGKKREEMRWLGPRRTEIIRLIRGRADGAFDTDLLNEYNRIGQVERDIHQVHNWPLDVGVLARLLAVILSMTAIVLSRVIANLFHF